MQTAFCPQSSKSVLLSHTGPPSEGREDGQLPIEAGNSTAERYTVGDEGSDTLRQPRLLEAQEEPRREDLLTEHAPE